jgi:hypothetical protein
VNVVIAFCLLLQVSGKDGVDMYQFTCSCDLPVESACRLIAMNRTPYLPQMAGKKASIVTV